MRPSTYTDEKLEEIVNRLSKGEPLAQICRDEDMPSVTTVWNWSKAHPHVSESIACAREEGEDWLAAECLEIADNATNDWMEHKTPDDNSLGWHLNGEHIQRSKLRIDTRLKLLSKWNPKKYGEKQSVDVDVTSKGESISPASSRLSDLAAKIGDVPKT